MAADEVAYYKLYKNQPLYFHFYVAPFVLIYLIWLYAWFMVYGVSDHFEIGAIVGVMILLVQILVWLFSMWSVHVRCFLTCSKVKQLFFHVVLDLIALVLSFKDLVRVLLYFIILYGTVQYTLYHSVY
jgi:hypothetical protein